MSPKNETNYNHSILCFVTKSAKQLLKLQMSLHCICCDVSKEWVQWQDSLVIWHWTNEPTRRYWSITSSSTGFRMEPKQTIILVHFSLKGNQFFGT